MVLLVLCPSRKWRRRRLLTTPRPRRLQVTVVTWPMRGPRQSTTGYAKSSRGGPPRAARDPLGRAASGLARDESSSSEAFDLATHREG